MALFDSERERVILRIVYDGAPGAGKSAILSALAEILRTPQPAYATADADNTAPPLEWLDYTGGLYEGRKIACQIVTTPSHPNFSAHRAYLQRSADVVVFVLDADPARLPLALEYFRGLQDVLASVEPPPRILIAANKQDLPGAFSEDSLSLFFPPSVKILPCSVAQNLGLRELFVFAVNLATTRMRGISASGGTIPSGQPEIHSGEELALFLQQQSLPPPDAVLAELLESAAAPEAEIEAESDLPDVLDNSETLQEVALPDMDMRWLWPPLAGQLMLLELAECEWTRHSEDGLWRLDDAGGWRCYSRPDWQYAGEEQAVAALRGHSARHVAASAMLPERRYLALSQGGQGYWRLWQIVYAGISLEQELALVLQETDAAAQAAGLLACADACFYALAEFSEYLPYAAITLANLGQDGQHPVYIGLLDNHAMPTGVAETSRIEQVLEHLQAAFSAALEQQRPAADLGEVLTALEELPTENTVLKETLAQLLLAHGMPA